MRNLRALTGMLLLLFCGITISAQDDVGVVPAPQAWPAEEITRFNQMQQTQAVEVRKLPQEKVADLKSSEDYWYANLEPQKKEQKQQRQQQNNNDSGLDGFLWIVILCVFTGAVIWYLASSNISLFRKPSRKIIDESIAEEETDDIFAINYEKEISKAVAEGNFRSAIRFWYLRTLKELSDRNIIDYRHEKTNNDYVNGLYGSRYYHDFFRLTRNFEYCWYGQFPLSPEAYQMMQTDFATFKAGLQG